MNELTIRTVNGVGWSGLSKVIQATFQLLVSTVLMRLLGPEAYGLIGIVLVFTGFAAVFSNLGFGSALIQDQECSEEKQSAVFSLTLLLGLLITAVLILASPLFANFYQNPRVQPLIIGSSFSFILSSPAVVPQALLQRGMRFRQLGLISVGSTILSGVVAITLAIRGFGVWALVAQSLVGAAVTSGLALTLVDWKPKLGSLKALPKEYYQYGGGLTGFNLVNYWARSIDRLLIGKFIGIEALGIYSRAYFFMMLPLTQILSAVSPVMFPTLSSIQNDKHRSKYAYLRAMRIISFIAFPSIFGLFTVTEPLVIGVFGATWAPMIPVMKILVLLGLVQSLCNPIGWIYLSQGRSGLMFKWGFFASTTTIIFLSVGVFFGSIESVAWSYVVSNIILFIPCINIPGRLIGMDAIDVLRAVSGNFACSGAMAAVVWVTNELILNGLPMISILVIDIPLSIIIYLLIANISNLAAFQEVKAIFAQLPYHRFFKIRHSRN